MTDRFFIDTNILVYLYDTSDSQKQAAAEKTFSELIDSRSAVVSPQVLAEFYAATTRKSRLLLTAEEAGDRLHAFNSLCEVVPLTGMITLEAVRGVQTYQFSVWDAQIWATAKLNQISTVLSEDFNIGSEIEGVRFLNPLGED